MIKKVKNKDIEKIAKLGSTTQLVFKKPVNIKKGDTLIIEVDIDVDDEEKKEDFNENN